MPVWPQHPDDLVHLQAELAAARPEPWRPAAPPRLVAGCFVCFPRGAPAGPGAAGDPAWAAAALMSERLVLVASAVAAGAAGAAYEPGLLALREGRLLEAAVRALPHTPEVLLVDATGRDHPRRAGLALHLGAVLGVPTVGVTHRPLVAEGDWPGPSRGEASPLTVDGEVVASWLRTRRGARPVAVHAAWRTDLEIAAGIVQGTCRRARTPEPLRAARTLARAVRAGRYDRASDG